MCNMDDALVVILQRTSGTIRNNTARTNQLRYDLGRIYLRHVVTHAAYDRLIKRDAL